MSVLNDKIVNMTQEEYENLSEDTYLSLDGDERLYLECKFKYGVLISFVSIRELFERFGFSTDGLMDSVLDLEFTDFYTRGRENKWSFTFSNGDGSLVIRVTPGDVERCVVFDNGHGGYAEYTSYGLCNCVS